MNIWEWVNGHRGLLRDDGGRAVRFGPLGQTVSAVFNCGRYSKLKAPEGWAIESVETALATASWGFSLEAAIKLRRKPPEPARFRLLTGEQLQTLDGLMISNQTGRAAHVDFWYEH